MYRVILLTLLLFPAIALKVHAENGSDTSFYLEPIPAWVKSAECPVDPIPPKPSQVNMQYLLSDTQRNWPEKAIYVHYAIKPLTIYGASSIGRVQIEFCPSYQTAIVHQIRVFREGKWLDRLQGARHSLLQREEDLENDLYHGTFTLVYFLEDIQVGDIVDCAFTIRGELPHFSTHLTNGFSLQGPVVFEQLHRRLVANRLANVDYKLFHTTEEPVIADVSHELREWSWELQGTPPYHFEEDMPEWHLPIAWVQFSQYKSWSEVIAKLLPLYTLDDRMIDDFSPEMVQLVQHWMETSSSAMERALNALRFVQEKIRYLGFEEGLDGLKPHDPAQVFEQRFGDCKDKTFLLHALLKCMGIDSTPVLVDVSEGKFLPDSIPVPFAFDHIILRVEMEGQEYWVDSTITHQGGSSLAENFCPIYHWGLPISASETDLVEIPGNFEESPTLIDTSFVVTSKEAATLKIMRTFRGHKADAMRRFFSEIGAYNYSMDFCDILQRSYGKASLLKDPILTDDRKKNILKLTQVFSVPTEELEGKKGLKAFSMTLINYLQNDFNPERTAPYALNYPVWVKEHLHVESPYVEWELDVDEDQSGDESLSYSYARKMEGSTFDAYYELMHLKDHVPTEGLREYWEMTSQIETNAYFHLYVADLEDDAA